MGAALEIQSQVNLVRRENTAPQFRQRRHKARDQVNHSRQSGDAEDNQSGHNALSHSRYSFPSFAAAFSAVSTAAIWGRCTRILTFGATSNVTTVSFKSVTLP